MNPKSTFDDFSDGADVIFGSVDRGLFFIKVLILANSFSSPAANMKQLLAVPVRDDDQRLPALDVGVAKKAKLRLIAAENVRTDFVDSNAAPQQSASYDEQRRGVMPLLIVALLHVLIFVVVQSGAAKHIAQAVPKSVYLTYIAPELPAPAKPRQTTPPKTVALQQAPLVTEVPPPAIITPVAVAVVTPPPAAPSAAAPQLAVVAPPSVPTPASPKTITAGVEYVQPPQPIYPSLAKRAGEEGKVMLRVLINDKGLPESVEIQKSSSFARLDEAARQAVLRARFKPYLEDGKAQAVFVVVPISFQLDR